MVVGTPDYIAPEQAEDAHAADIRSDVYSLGCTLYHMLAGRVPFPGDSVLRKLDAHRSRTPEPIRSRRLDVPVGLALVLAKMMAKDPAHRYQTPAEVAAALEPFVRGGAARPRRRWPLVAAAAVLFAGLAAAAVAVYRVETDKGQLVITTESDDVEVVIKQNGKEVRVIDTKTDKSITLWSGEYELELRNAGEGLKLNIDKATLTRGETILAKIERIPKLAGQAQSQPAEEVGEVRRFLGYAPSAWVTSAQFTPNGRRVVATNGSMRIWDAASGEPVRVWDASSGEPLAVMMANHTVWAWGLALAPDSKTAYESSDDGVVHIFDLEKAKEVGRLDAPGGGPTEVQLSADGKRLLITVLHVWKVRLCEVPGGKELAHLQGNGPAALSPDGAQVALCRDKRVVLWDVASDKEAGGFEMNVEGRQLAAFRFTPDGRFLVTAGSGAQRNVVRIWEVATGKERSSFNVPDVAADTILRLGVSPDGRRILTGCDPRKPATNPPIILWDVETAKEVCRLSGPEMGVFSLAFSPDGRSAVATGADGTVRLLRLPDASAAELPQKSIPLFNGKDLTGWLVDGGDVDAWRVEDGELVGRGSGQIEWLLTEQSYSDFRLRLEFKLSSRTNSGVALRTVPGEKDPTKISWPLHLEVQILDDANYRGADGMVDSPTGSLFWNSGSSYLRPDQPADLKPIGGWNEMVIESRGDSLQTWVNGRRILNADLARLAAQSDALPGLKRTSGRIGLQHQAGGEVRFRNIEIRGRLATPAPKDKP